MIPRMVILAHCISIHALREEGDLRLTPRPPRYAQYFYPRPPRGGRRPWTTCSPQKTNFYPRPPRGGRLMPGKVWNAPHGISIHALREEGDLPAAFRCTASRNFYPRPPRGGRRPARPGYGRGSEISIHALREEGDPLYHRIRRRQHISIHALREEGDLFLLSKPNPVGYFYPRPPRGGRRNVSPGNTSSTKFLSTPSARRATCLRSFSPGFEKFLSTPSARRATAVRNN